MGLGWEMLSLTKPFIRGEKAVWVISWQLIRFPFSQLGPFPEKQAKLEDLCSWTLEHGFLWDIWGGPIWAEGCRKFVRASHLRAG